MIGRHALAQQKYHATAKYRKWYKNYYKQNRERILNAKGRREKQRVYRRSKHGKNLAASAELIRHYGITLTDKEKMWKKQKGLCGLCFETLPGVSQCHIDHDHKTNKIRSLLHHHCNVGLGMFHDDLGKLKQAVAYLKKHGNKS